LGDKRVRQALNYGVNVEQIVDTWLDGYGMRYESWVNPPSNNPELTPWPYDPEMARQLLKEAGYTEGLTLTLRTPVDIYYHDVDIANTIAQQLAQIDVNVQVEPVSNWSVYARNLLSGNTGDLFLLTLNSHGNGLQDVKNLSVSYAFNPTGWQNDTFEELIERAAGNFNDTSRARLLNEAQAIAYEEAPWIWLWRKYKFYGVSQNLDWKPRRDGLIYLYQPVETATESGK
jgi:peptide/nickel transport system substrate-binding protein